MRNWELSRFSRNFRNHHWEFKSQINLCTIEDSYGGLWKWQGAAAAATQIKWAFIPIGSLRSKRTLVLHKRASKHLWLGALPVAPTAEFPMGSHRRSLLIQLDDVLHYSNYTNSNNNSKTQRNQTSAFEWKCKTAHSDDRSTRSSAQVNNKLTRTSSINALIIIREAKGKEFSEAQVQVSVAL